MLRWVLEFGPQRSRTSRIRFIAVAYGIGHKRPFRILKDNPKDSPYGNYEESDLGLFRQL